MNDFRNINIMCLMYKNGSISNIIFRISCSNPDPEINIKSRVGVNWVFLTLDDARSRFVCFSLNVTGWSAHLCYPVRRSWTTLLPGGGRSCESRNYPF